MNKELEDALARLSGQIAGTSWLLTSLIAALDDSTRARLAEQWAIDKAEALTETLLGGHRERLEVDEFREAFLGVVRKAESLLSPPRGTGSA